MNLFPDNAQVRQSLARQREVADLIAYTWDVDYWGTNEAAPLDLVCSRDRTVVGVVEIKTRDLTLDQLHRFDYSGIRNGNPGGFLISWSKVRYGAMASCGLRVPYRVVAGLYGPDGNLDAVRYWHMCDPITYPDRWLVDFTRHETSTRESSYSAAQVERVNAFLNIGQSHDLDELERGE